MRRSSPLVSITDTTPPWDFYNAKTTANNRAKKLNLIPNKVQTSLLLFYIYGETLASSSSFAP